MQAVYDQLKAQHPGLRAVVAAADEARAAQLQTQFEIRNSKFEIPIATGRVDEVLRWADVALVVSGTATLHCARFGVPMVSFFNVNRAAWWGLGRWLVRTHTFTLPNLIGESLGLGRVIPELVPHFGDPAAVAAALGALLVEGGAREAQRRAFDRFEQVFGQTHFAQSACDAVEAALP